MLEEILALLRKLPKEQRQSILSAAAASADTPLKRSLLETLSYRLGEDIRN